MSHVPCILIHCVELLPKWWFKSKWIHILIVQASNGLCRSYMPWSNQYLCGELILLLLNFHTHHLPTSDHQCLLNPLWLYDFNFELLSPAINIQSSSHCHRHHIKTFFMLVLLAHKHDAKKSFSHFLSKTSA